MKNRDAEAAEPTPFDPREAAWRATPDAMGSIEFLERLALAAGWRDNEEAWR